MIPHVGAHLCVRPIFQYPRADTWVGPYNEGIVCRMYCRERMTKRPVLALLRGTRVDRRYAVAFLDLRGAAFLAALPPVLAAASLRGLRLLFFSPDEAAPLAPASAGSNSIIDTAA